MVVYGPRESIPWFFTYVVLTAMSGVFDYFLATGDMSGVPMKTVAVFFVLNFTILSTIVYLLLRYFVLQKDSFQAELSLPARAGAGRAAQVRAAAHHHPAASRSRTA